MEILKKLVEGRDLSAHEAGELMEGIMGGALTHAQMAGALVALRMKGETPEEISEFARVMRKHAASIHPKAGMLADTCGTGGDSSHTFNVSTAAAIVACAAGVAVAKHGNRSVSSKCGSADVLEALGVKMLPPEKAEECINRTGFGFMFAPYFHPAMKNVMPVRKELGVRTVFNVLGPLTNPAGAQAQVLGVFDAGLLEKLADVLLLLGTKHSLVVHADGLDEIGLGKTSVREIREGKIREFVLDAQELGFENRKIPTCASKEESAKILLDVLSGKETGAALDAVLVNAGAAIYVAGKAGTIGKGVELAREAVASGKASAKLEEIRKFCEES